MNYKKLISKLFFLGYNPKLMPPNEREKNQILDIRKLFSNLGDADEHVSSEAERVWNRNLNVIKNKMINDDPRKFLSWDIVRKTMFVENASYIKKELAYLKDKDDWLTRWRYAIEESIQGCPKPYFLYWKSSGNLIHHAYHIARFEEKTGLKISELKTIFEFGGGYGSMCRLAHKLGFKGAYIIYDLPHLGFLQKYYLESLDIPVKAEVDLNIDHGVLCLNDCEDISKLNVGGENSLFIATWSFSEAPLKVREQLLRNISRFQSLLIAYQENFGEVNNVSFFSDTPEFGNFPNIFDKEIDHLPGSRYRFCW